MQPRPRRQQSKTHQPETEDQDIRRARILALWRASTPKERQAIYRGILELTDRVKAQTKDLEAKFKEKKAEIKRLKKESARLEMVLARRQKK